MVGAILEGDRVGPKNSSAGFGQSNGELSDNRLGRYSQFVVWKTMLALVTGQIEESLRRKLEFVLE